MGGKEKLGLRGLVASFDGLRGGRYSVRVLPAVLWLVGGAGWDVEVLCLIDCLS
jgi:hypothetical protein